MLNGLISQPKTYTVNTARIGIDTLIYIKQAIQVGEKIASVFVEKHNVLHQADGEMQDTPDIIMDAVNNFRDVKLTLIEKLIYELLCENTSFSKSNHEMRYQECFAVSTGIDGLLDAARTLYLQTLEEIFAVNT